MTNSLNDLRDRGYCVEEWERWQQGYCGTYAVALIRLAPHLRFGVLAESFDDGWSIGHFFAHDDHFAYDSAGRHPLPYKGIEGDFDVMLLDQSEADFGVLEEEGAKASDIKAAQSHARRNLLVPNRV